MKSNQKHNEIMNVIAISRVHSFLDLLFPERTKQKAIKEYYHRNKIWNTQEEERLRKFIVGKSDINVEGLLSGEWVEVWPGLMSKKTKETPYLTLLEGRAESDVEITEPHCHMTPDGPKNEVFFIVEGEIDFCLHDENTDEVTARVHRKAGEMMPIYPTDWHTIKMPKGTRYLVAIHPHI